MIKPAKRRRPQANKSTRPEWLIPAKADESSGWTTHFQRLSRTGLKLPKVDQVGNVELPRLLSDLIRRLAELRVFLMFTDHLSDRALYRQLTEEALHDPVQDIQPTGDMAYVIGLIGQTPHHLTTYLSYYASDRERAQLAENSPATVIPPRREPPFDRDRSLPRPQGGFFRP